MFELISIFIFGWLLTKVAGLALRLTWGAAKIIAGLLTVAALPLLLVCLLFAGGLALLLPLALIGIAFGVASACT